jgi:deoxycytidylate deaminase
MNAIERGIGLAARAANFSDAHLKVGAAILKGSRLISIGWNDSRKTHPSSGTRYHGIHAEFSAIVGNYKTSLHGATIFVARLKKNCLGMAKPCPACEQLIREAGIKKVYFTNNDGQVERLNV